MVELRYLLVFSVTTWAFQLKSDSLSDISAFLFKKCDVNLNNKLEISEFQSCANDVFPTYDSQQITDWMNKLDVNNDKIIDQNEFLNAQNSLFSNRQNFEFVDRNGEQRQIPREELLKKVENLPGKFENGKFLKEDTGKESIESLSSSNPQLGYFISVGMWAHAQLRANGYAVGNLSNIRSLPPGGNSPSTDPIALGKQQLGGGDVSFSMDEFWIELCTSLPSLETKKMKKPKKKETMKKQKGVEEIFEVHVVYNATLPAPSLSIQGAWELTEPLSGGGGGGGGGKHHNNQLNNNQNTKNNKYDNENENDHANDNFENLKSILSKLQSVTSPLGGLGDMGRSPGGRGTGLGGTGETGAGIVIETTNNRTRKQSLPLPLPLQADPSSLPDVSRFVRPPTSPSPQGSDVSQSGHGHGPMCLFPSPASLHLHSLIRSIAESPSPLSVGHLLHLFPYPLFSSSPSPSPSHSQDSLGMGTGNAIILLIFGLFFTIFGSALVLKMLLAVLRPLALCFRFSSPPRGTQGKGKSRR